MKATSLVLRYAVLIFLVAPLLLFLCIWTAGVRLIGQRPHWIVGQALGAPAVVRLWVRLNFGLIRRISWLLRLYLSRFHPRLASWIERRVILS